MPPDTYCLVPAFNFWLNREYESKHKNEHAIRVTTKTRNWGNRGSDTAINWGKSADVNIIALGFVKDIIKPCEYRLQGLNFTRFSLLTLPNCMPLRQILTPMYKRYSAPNILITVKATDETITNALSPRMEQADIIKRPVMFPATVQSERETPNCKLCVDTSNIAGPGIAAAIRAIEQNANQFSKYIIFISALGHLSWIGNVQEPLLVKPVHPRVQI